MAWWQVLLSITAGFAIGMVYNDLCDWLYSLWKQWRGRRRDGQV